tara:strand:- start:228 stop:524 length:297 start_codon:yes stop_codon:yes gene_type:complete
MANSTNDQVIKSFLRNSPARAGRLHTDGVRLFSYDLKIAEWIKEGGCIQTGALLVYDYTAPANAFVSMTTSQHVSLIKKRVPPSVVMLPEAAQHAGLI